MERGKKIIRFHNFIGYIYVCVIMRFNYLFKFYYFNLLCEENLIFPKLIF